MQIKGSDPISFEEAMAVGLGLIESGENPTFGLFVVCGANFGLRVSDLLTITYGQLRSGEFLLREKKTGKKRKVVVNRHVKDALFMMDTEKVEGFAFVSRKKRVYSSQHINRLMKEHFDTTFRNISSHSLRKGFGKRVYERTGDIAKLQLLFNHSSPEVTLAYIGVTQEQLDNIYNIIE